MSRDKLLRAKGHGKPGSLRGTWDLDPRPQVLRLPGPLSPLCSGANLFPLHAFRAPRPQPPPQFLLPMLLPLRVRAGSCQGPGKPGADLCCSVRRKQVMGQEKRPDLSSKTVSASLCQPKEKVLRKFFRPSFLRKKEQGDPARIPQR